MTWILVTCLEVFLLTLVGSLVPLALRRGARLQHLLASLAAGIFLGAVFLHLLPQVGDLAARGGVDHGDHAHGEPGIWLALLAGVVALFLVEQLLLRHLGAPAPAATGHRHAAGTAAHDAHGHGAHGHPVDELCHEDHVDGDARHRMVGMATMVGLSLHALADGLGLSAGHEAEALREALTSAVVSHKVVGGFSLGAALLLAHLPVRRVVIMLAIFAAVTPLAALARVTLVPDLSPGTLGLLTAFAAGSFLYVALCDLLPEVVHERRDIPAKVALVLVGLALSHLLHAH